MYPACWKFAAEGYEDATSVPYGCLLEDLKPDQDEQCRLRTRFSLGSCSTCMFGSKASDMRGEHWIAIYVDDDGHYWECFGRVPTWQLKITWTNIVANGVITAKSCRVLRVDSADIVVLAFVLLELEVLVWLILYAILTETLDWMTSLFTNLYVVSCSIVRWWKWNKWLKVNNSCFSFTHTQVASGYWLTFTRQLVGWLIW